MPLPFVLGALAVGTTVLGVAGHSVAKDTNEEAQRIAKNAEKAYDDAKQSLELSQQSTENSLVELGYLKKKVLETSVNQFIRAYDRIKDIKLSESIGLSEISNFKIDKQEVIKLQEMSSIYASAFSGGVAGATTGAAIALAASGSLPIVTGVLSTAGSALMLGQVGIATSLAGSALSFSAAMTPFGAVVAPVVFFSGLSSSIKADENLEKARVMEAEANVAIEKMKTSQNMSDAIRERADMFNDLLEELNTMFSACTQLLDEVTKDKTRQFGNKITAKSFTQDELKLIAATRSLAGAVKSVIDTPILNQDGTISDNSEEFYYNTAKQLPNFERAVRDFC